MKKLFKKIALVATIAATGMSMNSCFTQGTGLGTGLGTGFGTGLGTGYNNSILNSGSSSTQQKLLTLATLLTQVNGGSETSFVGEANFQRDYIKDGGWLFNPGTGQAKSSNYTAKLTVEGTTPIARIIGAVAKKTKGSSASISLGNVTVEGVTLSNLKLTAVSFDKKTGGIGDVEDAGYAYSVSYTMNNKTYTTPADFSSTPYAFVKGSLASANNNASINLNVQIAIDDNTQIEIEYVGNAK